jgi:molecular chaperone DnaK (HSP70)
LIPSAVYFDTNVIVGDTAMELGMSDPDGFAETFKRDIGKPHYSRAIRSYGFRATKLVKIALALSTFPLPIAMLATVRARGFRD